MGTTLYRQAFPLHFAAHRGEDKQVLRLLGHGASVDLQDDVACTPLHLAAWSGSVAVVHTLQDMGAQRDARNRDGSTPLHFAVAAGHGPVVSLLVKSGSNVHMEDLNGFTPLIIAANWGHTTIAAQLIDAGARVNAPNSKGNTALHFAAFRGHMKVVRILVNRGADRRAVNKENRTPFQLALMARHHAIAELLEALPPGWERFFEPLTGAMYFANRATKQTSWTPPPPVRIHTGHERLRSLSVTNTYQNEGKGATAVPGHEDLPPGWVKKSDAEGRTLFVNAEKRLVAWDRPTQGGSERTPSPRRGHETLPDGWERRWDPKSCRVFYAHTPTRRTQWDPPRSDSTSTPSHQTEETNPAERRPPTPTFPSEEVEVIAVSGEPQPQPQPQPEVDSSPWKLNLERRVYLVYLEGADHICRLPLVPPVSFAVLQRALHSEFEGAWKAHVLTQSCFVPLDDEETLRSVEASVGPRGVVKIFLVPEGWKADLEERDPSRVRQLPPSSVDICGPSDLPSMGVKELIDRFQ